MVNVYVCSLEEWLLVVVLTPVLQKPEKCRFYQEIGGCYKGTIILKNSVPIRSIPFKCIFVRLEKALMRGKNDSEIPLALYIRLEYSTSFIVYNKISKLISDVWPRSMEHWN